MLQLRFFSRTEAAKFCERLMLMGLHFSVNYAVSTEADPAGDHRIVHCPLPRDAVDEMLANMLDPGRPGPITFSYRPLTGR